MKKLLKIIGAWFITMIFAFEVIIAPVLLKYVQKLSGVSEDYFILTSMMLFFIGCGQLVLIVYTWIKVLEIKI